MSLKTREMISVGVLLFILGMALFHMTKRQNDIAIIQLVLANYNLQILIDIWGQKRKPIPPEVFIHVDAEKLAAELIGKTKEENTDEDPK